MKKYIIQMLYKYTGEIEDVDEEGEFDTYEEADVCCLECSSNFNAGAETLELAGEDYIDPDEVEFIVSEVDR